MFTDKTLTQFADEMASASPVPGGGSAAASVGAIGAALVSMVANLTIGREKYRDVEPDMKRLLDQSEALRHRMHDLLEADTQVYSRVMATYKLPRATEAEKAARTAAIQQALKDACAVPMDIARASLAIIELCPEVVAKGNAGVVSDAAVGAVLAAATLESAVLNVEINLASIKDEGFIAVHKSELKTLKEKAMGLKQTVVEASLARF